MAKRTGKKQPRWLSILEIPFAIQHDHENPADISADELISALQARLNSMRKNKDAYAVVLPESILDTYDTLNREWESEKTSQ